MHFWNLQSAWAVVHVLASSQDKLSYAQHGTKQAPASALPNQLYDMMSYRSA
jgi:hypothetical protein